MLYNYPAINKQSTVTTQIPQKLQKSMSWLLNKTNEPNKNLSASPSVSNTDFTVSSLKSDKYQLKIRLINVYRYKSYIFSSVWSTIYDRSSVRKVALLVLFFAEPPSKNNNVTNIND